MMHRRHGATALSALTIVLPPSTHNPYYYDLVGNVSTSRFRSPRTHSALLPSQQNKRTPAVLELQPRYPLMGGWNYSFTIGYDLPLGEFVRMRRGGRYVAAVPFLTPIRDVAVDDARVEIRLPEAARCACASPFSGPRDVLGG
jgi:oligosaccharyltransferase complex subunit alpha (ribophorin I)